MRGGAHASSLSSSVREGAFIRGILNGAEKSSSSACSRFREEDAMCVADQKRRSVTRCGRLGVSDARRSAIPCCGDSSCSLRRRRRQLQTRCAEVTRLAGRANISFPMLEFRGYAQDIRPGRRASAIAQSHLHLVATLIYGCYRKIYLPA
jgi:hypothetical protein